MKINRWSFMLITLLAAAWTGCPTVRADDVVITGTVSGTQTYESDEGIIFDRVVIANGAAVTTVVNFEVHLAPGTRITDGARFSVQMRDNDGLQNRCELYYFGNLDHGRDEDYDKDVLTNFQECTLGTSPIVFDMDNDDDGMEDWWEIKYFGLDLSNGRNDDFDGDGISNYIEYRLGLDPGASQNLRPGVQYDYDDLGRIIKIQRIPAY